MARVSFLKFLTLCFLPISSSLTAADIDTYNRQIIEITNQERALSEIERKLNQLTQDSSRYISIRSRYYYGENGVITKSDAWYEKASLWISKWKAMAELIKKTADSSLSLDDRRSIIQIVNDNHLALNQLQKDRVSIVYQIDKAIEILDSFQSYPDDYLIIEGISYQTILIDFKKRQRRLRDSFSNVRTTLENVSDTLLRVDQASEAALVGFLDMQILQFPALKDELDRALSTIEAQKILNPLLVKAKNIRLEMFHAVRQKAYFKAHRLFKELSDFVEESKTVVDTSSTSLEQKENSLKALDNVINGPKGAVSILAKLKKKVWINTVFYYRSTFAEVVPICKTNNRARLKYDCGVLKSLEGLMPLGKKKLSMKDYRAFKEMDEGLLQYVEGQLDKVYSSPIIEGDK